MNSIHDIIESINNGIDYLLVADKEKQQVAAFNIKRVVTELGLATEKLKQAYDKARTNQVGPTLAEHEKIVERYLAP